MPPMPTSRRPARGSHGASSSSVWMTCARSALRAFFGGVLGVGQEVLGHAHGAQRPRAEPAGMAAVDLDELQRAAAEVEHDAVGERRRVDRREVAVVGLLLAWPARAPRRPVSRSTRSRNSAWLEASRIALVATGDDVLRADPGRVAEVREDLGRLERALHRLGPELAGRLEPLADADGEVDLVGALPPAVGGREDDEAKGVGPEVDDGCPARVGHGAASAPGRVVHDRELQTPPSVASVAHLGRSGEKRPPPWICASSQMPGAAARTTRLRDGPRGEWTIETPRAGIRARPQRVRTSTPTDRSVNKP